MAEVIIKGFNNLTEARAFVDWYDGTGEQHIPTWLEELKHIGEIDVDNMEARSIETVGDNVVMTLDCYDSDTLNKA